MLNPQTLFENLKPLMASTVMEQAVTSSPNNDHFNPNDYVETPSLFESPANTAAVLTITPDVPSV